MKHIKGFTKGIDKWSGGYLGSAMNVLSSKTADPHNREEEWDEVYSKVDEITQRNSPIEDGNDIEDFEFLEDKKISPSCSQYIVQFSHTPVMASQLINHWLTQSWFLPSDWQTALTVNKPIGRYVPFYVFNITTLTTYEADVYVESVCDGNSKIGYECEDYGIEKAPNSSEKVLHKWEVASGDIQSTYSELIACASCSINSKLVDKLMYQENGFSGHPQRVLPMDIPGKSSSTSIFPTKSKATSPRTIPQTVPQIPSQHSSTLPNPNSFSEKCPILPLDLSKDDAWETIGGTAKINTWEEKKCKEKILSSYEVVKGSDGVKNLNPDTRITSFQYYIVLLPVFLTTIDYTENSYEVMVSGNKGVVVGERPIGSGVGGKVILDTLKTVGGIVTDTVSAISSSP
eukprot:TRINITY_DN2771_c0_g2_i2.p1 TRINITY_DN2771_c0_g2~~TRINITY_DN2771_c0_g2_i2.p1  ORF type:complete len:401 (-),score=77.00 TRINITY_DN2771_c0_g2_i2:156-1358(-)